MNFTFVIIFFCDKVYITVIKISEGIIVFRMDVKALPTWQDCHELWSKKRKRDQRVKENHSRNSDSVEPSCRLVTVLTGV